MKITMKRSTMKIIASLLVLTIILGVFSVNASADGDDEVVITHVKTWDQLKEALERGDKNIELNNTEPIVATSDINVTIKTDDTIEISSVAPTPEPGHTGESAQIDNIMDFNFTNYSINFYTDNPDLKVEVRFQQIEIKNYINPCVIAHNDNITLVNVICFGWDGTDDDPFDGTNVDMEGRLRSFLDVESEDILWTDIACINFTLPENATGDCQADMYVVPTTSPGPSESPDPLATPAPTASPLPSAFKDPKDPKSFLTPEEFGPFWGLLHYRIIEREIDDNDNNDNNNNETDEDYVDPKYKFEIKDGTGGFEIADIIPGTYILYTRYSGDDNYEKAFNVKDFTVSRLNTATTVSAEDSYYGKPETVSYEIEGNDDRQPLTGMVDVELELYNENTHRYETVYTDKAEQVNGKGSVTLNGLAAGDYQVTARYEGDTYYTESDGNTTFKVTYENTYNDLTVNASSEYTYGDTPVVDFIPPTGTTGNLTVEVYTVTGNNTYKLYYSINDPANDQVSLPDIPVGSYRVYGSYVHDNILSYGSLDFTVKAAPTPTPSPTPTASPSPTPTASPSPTPTASPSPTPEPTAEPTAVPTAEPTAVPTAEPTVTPTAVPTAEPTATPTTAPTAEPTVAPTTAPTEEPRVDASDAEKTILKAKTENDLKGSRYHILQLKQNKVKKNSILIKWKKVSGAKKYVIYGGRCGRSRKYKKITTTKKTSYIYKKLEKGTYYKITIVALDSNDKVITIAKLVHVATSGGKKGNVKAIKTNVNKVTVNVGNSYKIIAKEVLQSKKLPVSYHRKLTYESDDPMIATIDKKGVVKGLAPGTCNVYVYSQNGLSKMVKVIVQ